MQSTAQRCATVRKARKNAPRPPRPAPPRERPTPGSRTQTSPRHQRTQAAHTPASQRARRGAQYAPSRAARKSRDRTQLTDQFQGEQGRNLVKKQLGADSPRPRGAGAAAARDSTRRAGSVKMLASRKQDAQGASGEGETGRTHENESWVDSSVECWRLENFCRIVLKIESTCNFQKVASNASI